MNIKLTLLDGHLFTQLSIDDKVRQFLVDCGSNLSYIYFEPLGFKKSGHIEQVYEVLCGRCGNQVMVNAEEGELKQDIYYLIAKPGIIMAVEKEKQLTIDGVIGMDWLLRNKIVLNFGKLK